jgi:hypothetical protein
MSSGEDSSDDDRTEEGSVVPEKEFSDADLRLQQIRRGARDKERQGFASKLAGLKSIEEINKEQSLQRIKDGLYQVLTLHSPVELSSCCGMLGLKVQQKPINSIEQIMGYALSDMKQEEGKLQKVLHVCWEGALFEYLRALGQPVYTEFTDPRETVSAIWQKGGILDSRRAFTPHFVRREIKKRYANVQAEDITSRFVHLRDIFVGTSKFV